MIRRLRTLLALVAILLLQIGLFNQLRVGGITAEAMLAVSIVAGYAFGPDMGAKIGFVSGLLYDIVLLTTPLGLTAASYVLVGYGTGVIREGMTDPPWWMRLFGVAIASAAGVLIFAVLGEVVGQNTFEAGRLPRLWLWVGVWNSAIALPIGAVLRFAVAGVGETERDAATA
jgi:rod shape-determining protein MreD